MKKDVNSLKLDIFVLLFWVTGQMPHEQKAKVLNPWTYKFFPGKKTKAVFSSLKEV